MSTKTALLASLLFAGACDKAPSNNQGSGATAGSVKGARTACKGQQCLPDVNYVDTIGKAYTPADLAGKVVVVNFWATWCKPCLKEIPDLSKVQERYLDKGVVVLGVMTDNPDSQQLLNFQSDNDMRYPVVRVNSDIMVSYQYPEHLPTTFVFDRSGTQVFQHVGALTEAKLAELLDPLVAQKQ
ncbi:MAG TPA: TlpA disulfide reductase family protein [Kofleriaceae bacterium]|nr:TlpA disulfide reductase family protein [Kofleriaceae bacterium]